MGNGTTGKWGQAWTGIHIEGFFVDAGATDLFAFDIGGNQLEINPRPQIMIMSFDLTADQGVGKSWSGGIIGGVCGIVGIVGIVGSITVACQSI